MTSDQFLAWVATQPKDAGRFELIVYEVLSPSSMDNDFSVKLSAYLGVPSIQHYLIVDTERPAIIHHKRGDGETWVTRILHPGKPLRLDPPGIAIDDVAAIFA